MYLRVRLHVITGVSSFQGVYLRVRLHVITGVSHFRGYSVLEG